MLDQCIAKAGLRRLARRGGIKRVQSKLYPELRGALNEYLNKVSYDAAVLATHGNRKTIKAIDICYAMKKYGTSTNRGMQAGGY